MYSFSILGATCHSNYVQQRDDNVLVYRTQTALKSGVPPYVHLRQESGSPKFSGYVDQHFQIKGMWLFTKNVDYKISFSSLEMKSLQNW
jgi:hypothetical protein